MSNREATTNRRLAGDTIRPPDSSTRSERPKGSAKPEPLEIDVGGGPTTNPPPKGNEAPAGSSSDEAKRNRIAG